ncbi:MAG: septum formation initiator family protein [bacterium]|nr:septum formation initiator family protein [bacterium]
MFWRRIRERALEPPPAEYPTDARRAGERLADGAPDPEAEGRARFRRRVVGLVVSAVFVAGSVQALFGDQGYLDVVRLRQEQQQLTDELVERRQYVERLRAEVEGLRDDPASLERIARERLGYIRPGEVTFLFDSEGGGLTEAPRN